MLSLFEALVAPPTHLGTYLRIRLKSLKKIAADLEQATTEWQQFERDGASMLRSWLRYAEGHNGNSDACFTAVYQLPSIIKRPNNYVPAEECASNIEAWIKYNDRRFAEHLNYWLENSTPLPDDLKTAIAILAYGEQGAKEYGYEPDDPESSSNDDEYVAAMHYLAALRKGANALLRGEAEISNLKRRLGAQNAMRDGIVMKGEHWRPDTDEIETLYHATAFATEIARDGFVAEPPRGRRGLGNYGNQNEISFTYDRAIAENIVRTLQEMWMIAHGQITLNTVFRWMDAEGISRRNVYSVEGPPRQTIEYAAKAYRIYRGHTKLRADPVLTYPEAVAAMMEDRRLEDIGLIQAQVRIPDDARHLFAEREFRVPPSSVVSVKRIR